MRTDDLKREVFRKLSKAGLEDFSDPETAALHVEAARSFGAGTVEEEQGSDTYARMCYRETENLLERMEKVKKMEKQPRNLKESY